MVWTVFFMKLRNSYKVNSKSVSACSYCSSNWHLQGLKIDPVIDSSIYLRIPTEIDLQAHPSARLFAFTLQLALESNFSFEAQSDQTTEGQRRVIF